MPRSINSEPPLKRARRSKATTSPYFSTSNVSTIAEGEDEKTEDIKVIRSLVRKSAVKSREDSPKTKSLASSPTKSPKKPTVLQSALEKAHPAPTRWKEAYSTIEKQRERVIAAVDTMGCEQAGRTRGEPIEQENRLAILVSLMLSSQTKDPVTHQAVINLRKQLPGGLTVASLLMATPDEVNNCISKVGFHNIKTANLKKLALRLKEEHDSKVPEDMPSLLAINGVGPKMAILFSQAIGINCGIGVDVHVHRITNRLGWHKPKTVTPEQTRLNLESWLPKELHPKINLMLVGFGQEICRPVGPRCDLCDVAKIKNLCPSRRIPPMSTNRRNAPSIKKDEDVDSKVAIKIEGVETVLSSTLTENSIEGFAVHLEVVKVEKEEEQLLW